MKRSLKTFSQTPAYFEPLQIDSKENHSTIKAVGSRNSSNEFELYKVYILNIALQDRNIQPDLMPKLKQLLHETDLKM